MSTRPLIRTAIVGLPAGLLLSLGGGLGRTLAIVAGAALIGFAWARCERRGAADAAPTAAQACDGHDGSADERRTSPERRIDRTQTGRGPRDVRCPSATRASARARRSR